ncbi:MAG: hypothetical protein K0R50_603 [Eubacterium sp.]|jgi:hypothetical protein|nr:hypothetical protein [Eubacterium sp.]
METRLSDIDLFQVYKNWKIDLGPFECFVKSTNFVSLKHYPDFVLNPGFDNWGIFFDKIHKILQEYDYSSTLFLLDVNGTEAIKAAYCLRELLSVAPIPVFNGVMHPFGLVGSREYISLLIAFGLKNKAREQNGYIFVLNSDRYGDYTDKELRENFNNQYELGEEDLPPVEMLELLKYKRVCYLCDRDKEDMAGYLEYLSNSNISVEKINLVG